MTAIQTVGFIGTGAITAAVVKALRSKGTSPIIYLSPRSEEVSRALACELPNVYRENSNTEVVSKSQIVVLAMLPEQLSEAISGITFRAEQTVVSFVATVPITQIANLVAPAKMICRATPLTTIEKKRGPVVVAPANAAVEALFDGLGDVIVADTEDQMMAFGSAAAMVSTFHELEHTVAQWLSTTGVNPASASLYVRSMFAGIANSALENRNLSLSLIADSNETPGGLNERVRRSLRDAGMFTRIERTLSELSSLSLVQPTNCEPTRDESHAGH